MKSQSGIVLLGMGLTFLTILITNFVFVLILDISFFLSFTPVFSLIFSVSFVYGIFKRQLYEFRVLATKSLIYLLSIGITIVIPSYAVIYVFHAYIDFSDYTINATYITALLTVLIILHNPISKLFNSATNRIFFRNTYNVQNVIDKLSEMLAGEIILDNIIRRSSAIIGQAIKVQNFTLVVFNENKIYKKHDEGYEIPQIGLYKLLTKLKKSLTIRDDLEPGKLKSELEKFNISLAIQLHTREEKVGYILLGDKLSGNIFSSQDLELLNIAANELAISIQNARNYEQIQEFNITLQHKIEEATKKLRKTNDKLRALDEAKDEFISMASHQLRTPLTSVKGYMSMVLEGDAGKVNKKQSELLNSAYISSQRMVYLIADLLNVSRLKTGKFVIESKEVDLPKVIEAELEQLKETAKNRNLTIKFSKPHNFPLVMLDETKIRQVIMNFVDNAIYYTPSGGTIKIILESDDSNIFFKVIDNGIGVPKEEQHKLFSKFYRAGNAKKARPDGTGLGLFMAKKVIVAQGGALIFESKLGQGSTFGFRFPLKEIEVKSKKSNLENKKATKK